MINQKKIDLAYKKYIKNFQDESMFENSITKYEGLKNVIENIIEANEKEKDHILLIRIGSIFAHYHLIWKKDVLINGNNSIDGLKQLQISLFYQCMSQDLYKIRYPRMMVSYTFKDIVSSLVHFTMYGWEKEESILYNFIADHIGENSISANNSNRHTWFLMELYLRYRNKKILGTNQDVYIAVGEELMEREVENDLIPDDLDIYEEVLDRWSTSEEEEITALIDKMIIYHSERVLELGNSVEFGDYRYGFYPYEILFLIHVRKKQGLPVPEHFKELLMNTPEARMVHEDPESYPERDPLMEIIDQFYRKNYPEYVPNQYGDELFQ
ncbi:hypothetical protein [Gorillibacterium massiliense]|uniref:hypothetical protein n=1 Tax=Gorillibacterium massiliense TaxID=1280390 RepID=UPI0004B9FBB3|nr:hypothetical protein [Gorillibacterium massiliense]